MKLLYREFPEQVFPQMELLSERINKGFLVLIGIGAEDGKKEADLLVRKMCGLRIFEDQDGKTNLALKDVDGELLLISQFTHLCKHVKKEICPSFN